MKTAMGDTGAPTEKARKTQILRELTALGQPPIHISHLSQKGEVEGDGEKSETDG